MAQGPSCINVSMRTDWEVQQQALHDEYYGYDVAAPKPVGGKKGGGKGKGKGKGGAKGKEKGTGKPKAAEKSPAPTSKKEKADVDLGQFDPSHWPDGDPSSKKAKDREGGGNKK